MSTEKKHFIISLLISVGILAYIIFSAEAMSDYGDGISHYFISKYSWEHPELFLNSWGKPFFTFTSSFFSQFGIKGILVFNILCAFFSAICCYKIAQKFDLKFLWTIPILLCSAPIYFLAVNSGLTEPFFAFILIASIALAVYDKNIWAAILLSFLPFVRSEGFLIMPFFGLLFLFQKNYKAIIFLIFGYVVYSIIGGIYFKNILWISQQNPYNGAEAIYGSGSIFHFLEKAKDIWGIVFTGLFVIGIFVFMYQYFQKIKHQKWNVVHDKYTQELLLIFGSFFVVLIAHTLFWYLGIFSSLGLTRVMAATIPVAVLMALRGFSIINLVSGKAKKIIASLIVILVLLCFIQPVTQNLIPYHLGKEEKVVTKASEWFEKNKQETNHIYYMHPYITFMLDLDPYAYPMEDAIFGLRKGINSALQKNDIVMWDAHYCANEGGIELETLLKNKRLKLLYKSSPEEAFRTLGKYDFEVYIFQFQ